MARISLSLVWAACVFFAAPSPAVAADTPKAVMKAEDRTKIQQSLDKADAFVKAVQGKKVVASTMTQYRHKKEGAGAESDYAQTLHFRYDDGKTIKTTLDIAADRVEKVEELEAYPTPLATEELEAAKKLAAEADPKAKALLAEKGVVVDHLVPLIAERSNPLFGKRLVELILTPQGRLAATHSLEINLTDGRVIVKPTKK